MPDQPPMQIDPAMAGLQEPDYQLMADAIFRAEGGDKAKAPYGVLSVKTKGPEDARKIAINSARNNFKRWVDAGKPGTYVEFMANRWVPEKADPKGNANWKRNVPAIYSQLLAQQAMTNPPVRLPYAPTNMPAYRP